MISLFCLVFYFQFLGKSYLNECVNQSALFTSFGSMHKVLLVVQGFQKLSHHLPSEEEAVR